MSAGTLGSGEARRFRDALEASGNVALDFLVDLFERSRCEESDGGAAALEGGVVETFAVLGKLESASWGFQLATANTRHFLTGFNIPKAASVKVVFCKDGSTIGTNVGGGVAGVAF